MKIQGFNREESLSSKKYLSSCVKEILIDCWGHFDDEFIIRHIIDSERVLLAYEDKKPVGLCSLDVIKLSGKKVYYIEFLAVKKQYQGKKIASKLINSMVIYILMRSFYRLFFKPVEIMFITPNIKILSFAAKNAHFIYPDPRVAQKNGKIKISDEETWEMVQRLVKESDMPNRHLQREASVLFGSYDRTPWLIYNGNNIPWHRDDRINKFAKRYLGYGKGEDKEFVVRMQVSFKCVSKYFISRIAYIFKQFILNWG